jgi:hypothetical protein
MGRMAVSPKLAAVKRLSCVLVFTSNFRISPEPVKSRSL